MARGHGDAGRQHEPAHHALRPGGWRESVSEINTPGGAVARTFFADHDPFGRPGKITPPEGGQHNVIVVHLGDRSVERKVQVATGRGAGGAIETQESRIEILDRQGRLWRVWEPTGAGGALEPTTYGYDVGGRLSSVSQGGSQSRQFSYDHRGFLLSERHPEKGVAGGGTVSSTFTPIVASLPGSSFFFEPPGTSLRPILGFVIPGTTPATMPPGGRTARST